MIGWNKQLISAVMFTYFSKKLLTNGRFSGIPFRTITKEVLKQMKQNQVISKVSGAMLPLLSAAIQLLKENDESTGQLEDMLVVGGYSNQEILNELVYRLDELSAADKVDSFVLESDCSLFDEYHG